jgi:hypothetical protein
VYRLYTPAKQQQIRTEPRNSCDRRKGSIEIRDAVYVCVCVADRLCFPNKPKDYRESVKIAALPKYGGVVSKNNWDESKLGKAREFIAKPPWRKLSGWVLKPTEQ